MERKMDKTKEDLLILLIAILFVLMLGSIVAAYLLADQYAPKTGADLNRVRFP